MMGFAKVVGGQLKLGSIALEEDIAGGCVGGTGEGFAGWGVGKI